MSTRVIEETEQWLTYSEIISMEQCGLITAKNGNVYVFHRDIINGNKYHQHRERLVMSIDGTHMLLISGNTQFKLVEPGTRIEVIAGDG